jgi:hypothetical protein
VVYKQVFDGRVYVGQTEIRIPHRAEISKGLIPAMAETTTTNTTTTQAKPKAKPAARRTTTRRTATRRTAARKPSTATARRQRTIAKNETREAAEAQARAARTTAVQGRNVAERAALVYVGATLEARDRVLDLAGELVNRFGTRAAAEREVNKDIRRFERRGNTARNQLERDVRKARTRLERAVRTRRREVSSRAQDAAQLGVATGNRIATVAKERVIALV